MSLLWKCRPDSAMISVVHASFYFLNHARIKSGQQLFSNQIWHGGMRLMNFEDNMFRRSYGNNFESDRGDAIEFIRVTRCAWRSY